MIRVQGKILYPRQVRQWQCKVTSLSYQQNLLNSVGEMHLTVYSIVCTEIFLWKVIIFKYSTGTHELLNCSTGLSGFAS